MERRRETVTSFVPGRVPALRADRDLTVGDVAERAGLYRQNLNTIETGKRSAAFDTVLAIADALDVDPLELTDLDPDELTVSGLRLTRRISRVELAERCDMSYALWWAIETGRRQLTDDRAPRVADVLGVDVDALHEALRRELDRPSLPADDPPARQTRQTGGRTRR